MIGDVGRIDSSGRAKIYFTVEVGFHATLVGMGGKVSSEWSLVERSNVPVAGVTLMLLRSTQLSSV
jgi:hypothetical protein